MDQSSESSIKKGNKTTITRFIQSHAPHRKASRANAFFEVAGTFASTNLGFGINQVPVKTAQMLISGYTAFYLDTSWPEKLLHLAQASLACGLIALNIFIYLRNDECLQVASTFCQVAFICESLYKGIMLTGWGASELVRKSSDPTDSTDSSNNRFSIHDTEAGPELIIRS